MHCNISENLGGGTPIDLSTGTLATLANRSHGIIGGHLKLEIYKKFTLSRDVLTIAQPIECVRRWYERSDRSDLDSRVNLGVCGYGNQHG